MKNKLKEDIRTIIVLGEESWYLGTLTGKSKEEQERYQDVQDLLQEYQKKVYLEVLGNFIRLSDYIRRGIVIVHGQVTQEELLGKIDQTKFEYGISKDTVTALIGILEVKPGTGNINSDIVVRIRLNPILYED